MIVTEKDDTGELLALLRDVLTLRTLREIVIREHYGKKRRSMKKNINVKIT